MKGHLLLRQADLADHERHVVIGSSTGPYEVKLVSAALSNIFLNIPPTESTIKITASHGYYQNTEATLETLKFYQPYEVTMQSHGKF